MLDKSDLMISSRYTVSANSMSKREQMAHAQVLYPSPPFIIIKIVNKITIKNLVSSSICQIYHPVTRGYLANINDTFTII